MSKESIVDRIMKMVMTLDKNGLHARLLVLTYEDYIEISKECSNISSCDIATIETFMGIPIAKTMRYNFSFIITTEVIDIIKSFEGRNK